VAVSPDGKSVYLASGTSRAITIFQRNAQTGALTQANGTGGCVSEDGAGGCAVARAIEGIYSVAVSPDGESVYAASPERSAIMIFDRDPTTGALTQKPGLTGCISSSGNDGGSPNSLPAPCTPGDGIDGVQALTVSGDRDSLYAVSPEDESVTVFDRAASGALTQKAPMDGCISDSTSLPAPTNCAPTGIALGEAQGVAVSPDDDSVYVSAADGAVVIFDRDATGLLTQKPAPDGCISEDGTGGLCAMGTAFTGPGTLTVSADNRSVYVAAGAPSNAVAILDRNPTTGVLTQDAGADACVSETLAGCSSGVALLGAQGVVVSPDGKSVYVAASGSNGIAVFDRGLQPLTVTTQGTGSGFVDSSPGTIDCGRNIAGHAECSERFEESSVVTLTANPSANTDFAGFSGGGCTTSPCTLTMDQATTVTATFTLKQRLLTVSLAGDGQGVVQGSGIFCDAAALSDCSESFPDGTMVVLTATAAAGSVFAGFSGAGCSSSPCAVTMSGAQNVTATFSQPPAPAPTPDPAPDPAPDPTPTPDPLTLTLTAKKTQRLGRFSANATCSNDCSLSIELSARVGGETLHKDASQSLDAGDATILRPIIRHKVLARIERKLSRSERRGRGRIAVTATDDAGETATETVRFTIKP
jgi:DNA-binding beta-propeller fold protein YncE